MSLSISKLNNICETNGLVPLKYFKYKDNLLFLQTISLKKGFSFMINIPKKFTFEDDLDGGDVYKLKKIKFDKETLKQLYKSPDNKELDKIYSEIKVAKEFDPNLDVNELEEKLMEVYKKQIYLSKMDKEELHQIRDIFRQIERLKLCVQGIDYKITIIFKNYLCCVDEDGEIECYYIKHFKSGFYRKLFISLNLTLLFDNISNLENHLQEVYDGVNEILARSQESHLQKFLITIDSCRQVGEKINKIKEIRMNIKGCIQKYENTLNKLILFQKSLETKFISLQKNDNLENNLNYIREKNKIEKELSEVEEIKVKVMEQLVSLRDKDSDISLKVDKILFDNILMLNNIINNLKIFDNNK